VRLACPQQDVRDRVRNCYAAFLSPPHAEPDFRLRIHRPPASPRKRSGPTQWAAAEEHPRLRQEGDRLRVQRCDFDADFDLGAATGGVTCRRGGVLTGIESALRICYSVLAVLHDGLILHAAGIARNGRGYVFAGPSGAGKSTIAGLCSPAERVLSDELVVVRRSGTAFHVHGTPFRGTSNAPPRAEAAALEGVYFPVKDRNAYVRPAPRTAAVRNLLACALAFGQTADYADRLLSNVFALVDAVPNAYLHFAKRPDFWRLLGRQDAAGTEGKAERT